jgi:hypothetical protein
VKVPEPFAFETNRPKYRVTLVPLVADDNVVGAPLDFEMAP